MNALCYTADFAIVAFKASSVTLPRDCVWYDVWSAYDSKSSGVTAGLGAGG